MIVTLNVPVIRDEKLEFLDDFFLMSFLPSAAPLATEYLARSADRGRLYQLLEIQLRKILQCCVLRGHRTVVLRLWG
jgi:hypothetical protein